MKNYKPYGCSFLTEVYNNYYKAWKFEFSCSSRDSRSWFIHECTMYFWDVWEWTYKRYAKRQYYNRTWERFCFESVMKDCFIEYCLYRGWSFIEENKKDIKRLCKDFDINYYFKFL